MCNQDGSGGGIQKRKGKVWKGGRGKSLERRDESQRGRGWKKVRSEKRNGKWGRGLMSQPQQDLTEPLGGAGSKPGELREKI